ncbi:MAG: SDR family oxidoreductase [Gammaproteobacteria bacterium]|nr:SDR family oxidoreductase [Gammaproteobacteria bacterium]
MSNILIAGCGDVGGLLGSRLVRNGHTVWGLRRQTRLLPPALQPIAADLACPSDLAALPKGLQVVVYTAAAAEFSEAGYRTAYLDGVQNLLQALQARAQPVSRFLFVSSTGVYGQTDGEWVDERSPAQPGSFSGRILLQAEQAVLASEHVGTVVRFGGIYGPGRRRLMDGVRRGDGCMDRPPVYTNRIHRDDCAAVLEHLMALAQPADVYIGVDSCPAPQCEVMDWLAAQLGVAPPPRISADPNRSPQRANKRCRNDRLVASGYAFRYPSYREGYTALLRDAGM